MARYEDLPPHLRPDERPRLHEELPLLEQLPPPPPHEEEPHAPPSEEPFLRR